jgi:hypothetical protein
LNRSLAGRNQDITLLVHDIDRLFRDRLNIPQIHPMVVGTTRIHTAKSPAIERQLSRTTQIYNRGSKVRRPPAGLSEHIAFLDDRTDRTSSSSRYGKRDGLISRLTSMAADKTAASTSTPSHPTYAKRTGPRRLNPKVWMAV